MANTYNWKKNKVYKISIDNSNITENLENFPVLLNLTNDSGINNYNCVGLFDELGSKVNRKKISVIYPKVQQHYALDYEDPYWSNVLLAMPMSGSHGSVMFTDIKGNTISVIGNAIISTATSVNGGSSAWFDGAGDRITTTNLEFAFGTNNFCIDFWIRINGTGTDTYARFIQIGANTTQGALYIFREASTTPAQIKIDGYNGGAYFNVGLSSSTLVTDIWYHLALERINGVFFFYKNGVLESLSNYYTGSYGVSKTYSITQTNLNVGSNTANAESLEGFIDNLRVTKSRRFLPDYTINESDYYMYVQPDPYWINVVLYLPMNGADGSTSIYDYKGGFLSAQGNASISTTNSRFGGASLYLDGTGDCVLGAYTTDLNLYNISFTIEAWIYAINFNNSPYVISANANDAANRWAIQINSNGTLSTFITSGGVGAIATGTSIVPTSQWVHIAASFDGTNFRTFINGILDYVGPLPRAFGNANHRLELGTYSGTSNYFYGYIDDVRITKQIARYTGCFTLPAAEFSNNDTDWTSVVLLLNMNGTNGSTNFIDEKGNTIYSYGGAALNTARSKFGISSGYFDGVNDGLELENCYLSTSNSVSALGCVDFTVEAWVYYTSGDSFLFFSNGAPGSGMGSIPTNRGGLAIYTDSSNGKIIILAGNLSLDGWTGYLHRVTVNGLTLNTWNHVAITCVSNIPHVFINGLEEALTFGNGSTSVTSFSNLKCYSPRRTCIMSYNTYEGVIDSTAGTGAGFYRGYIDDLRITKNLARYSSRFTVPTTSFISHYNNLDPYWNNVVLNMPLTTEVKDQKNHTLSTTGSPTISSNQRIFDGNTCYFGGNGSGINITTGSEFNFSTNNFTIECWVYVIDYTVIRSIFYKYITWATNMDFALRIGTNGLLRFMAGDSATISLDSTEAIPTLKWIHLAICRESGVTSLFINGRIQGNTHTGSVNIPNDSSTLRIGTWDGSSGESFYGYISNIRITKDIARYSENFTPTVCARYAQWYTQNTYWEDTTLALPLDQDVGVVELKGHTINTSVITSDNVQVIFGKNGYYFNGTTDYVLLNSSTDFYLGSEEFTIDFWVNTSQTGPNYSSILHFDRTGGDITGLFSIYSTLVNNASTISFSAYNGTSWITISWNNTKPGEWTNITFIKRYNMIFGYQDGVYQSVNDCNFNIGVTNRNIYIGLNNTASAYFNGFLRNFKIIRRTSLYVPTFTFTPPTDILTKSLQLKSYTHTAQEECYCEIENWDHTNKSIQLWTKVPKILYDQPTDLFLFYDSTQPDNTDFIGDIDEAPAQQVWDTDYKLVMHMVPEELQETTWTPEQIPKALWLDAADSSTTINGVRTVTQWLDKSGNNNNFSQGNKIYQPTLQTNTINGLNTIRFNNSQHIFNSTFQLTMSNKTVFIVFRENTSVSNAGLFCARGTTNDWNSSDGFVFGPSNKTSVRFSYLRYFATPSELYWTESTTLACPLGIYAAEETNTNNATLWINGVQKATDASYTAPSAISLGGVVIGARYTGAVINPPYLDGDVCEIIYLASTLSTEDRQKIEGYLAWKWGLVSSLQNDHPYKTESVGIWTPAYISTELWLDASDNETLDLAPETIAQWLDKSGNNRHATQNTVEKRPTITTSGISFDGINNWLVTPTYSSSVLHMIFIVAEVISTDTSVLLERSVDFNSNPNTIYLGVNSSTQYAAYVRHTTGVYTGGTYTGKTTSKSIITSVYTGNTTLSMYINGILQTSTPTDSASGSSISSEVPSYIGTRGGTSRYINAIYREILHLDNNFSNADRQRVEGYLAWKWGLVANLPASHPYKFYPPRLNTWTPESIEMALWLDASDSNSVVLDGAGVSQWTDKSSNTRNFIQATPSLRPTVSNSFINGLNVVYLNGTQIMSSASAILLEDSQSVFAVVQAAPQNNASILAQHTGATDVGRFIPITTSDTGSYDKLRTFFNNNTNYTISSTTTAFLTTTPTILYSESNGTGRWAVRVNGGSEEGVLTGQTLTPFNTPMRLGGVGTTPSFTGYVCEIIITQKALSEFDRQLIEGYLAHKWGLTSSLPSSHPYKYVAPSKNMSKLLKDSTNNNNNGYAFGINELDIVTTSFGKALRLDNNDYINVLHSSSLAVTNQVSIETVVKVENYLGDTGILTKGFLNGKLTFGMGYNTTRYPFVWSDSDGVWGPSHTATSNTILIVNEEMSLGSSFNGETIELFKDANKVASATASPITMYNDTTPITIGKTEFWAANINGYIRELRISRSVRSESWLKASHYSLIDQFVNYSEAPIHVYEGYVTQNNTIPIQRTVYLYNRDSGELMDKYISTNDGYYIVSTTISGLHNIICLDDDTGTDLNDLILSKKTPVYIL